jgi:hypothetical protein
MWSVFALLITENILLPIGFRSFRKRKALAFPWGKVSPANGG